MLLNVIPRCEKLLVKLSKRDENMTKQTNTEKYVSARKTTFYCVVVLEPKQHHRFDVVFVLTQEYPE